MRNFERAQLLLGAPVNLYTQKNIYPSGLDGSRRLKRCILDSDIISSLHQYCTSYHVNS